MIDRQWRGGGSWGQGLGLREVEGGPHVLSAGGENRVALFTLRVKPFA